jgi:hypothetical protein
MSARLTLTPPRPDKSLDDLVRESIAHFNALPPEDQESLRLAQRISFIYGQVAYGPDDGPRAEPYLKEDVARRVLTYSIGPHTAEQRLSDPRFRKLLGLPECE